MFRFVGMATRKKHSTRFTGTPVKHTLLLTGVAGYVGSRILELASSDARVERIIAIDREAPPSALPRKVQWIEADLAEAHTWEELLQGAEPHAIIHAAWHVRIPYGKEADVRAQNLSATRALAAFALRTPSVRSFVFISSAAVFGAFASNHPSYAYTEADVPREDEYPYAAQKREAEEILARLWQMYTATPPALRIVRPVSVVGPRARERKEAFALSALFAQVAHPSAHWLGRLVQRSLRVFPAPSSWRRHYVHEDDVARAVLALALEAGSGTATAPVAVYHLAGPGGAVDPAKFAAMTGRPWIRVPVWMVRIAFWLAWHLSRGAVPTCRGVWRFYAYPIVVDGSRVTQDFSFRYQFTSPEALAAFLASEEKEGNKTQ